MLILWVLIIIASILLLKYSVLLYKRIRLIHKLKKISSKPLRFSRNRFASVFVTNGKTDIILNVNDREHCVSIITTPFRRVRYHFTPTSLEIILERSGTVLRNYNKARPDPARDIYTMFTVKRYKLKPIVISTDSVHFYIVHPAPKVTSVCLNNKIAPLDNGDIINEGIIACGLQWYLRHAKDNNFFVHRNREDD